jgi:hypothetical protein
MYERSRPSAVLTVRLLAWVPFAVLALVFGS